MLADRLARGAAQVLPLHAHIFFYTCLRALRCVKEWVLMSSASKTASKRDELNGTERDGRRRSNLRIRDKLGLTERTGTEWNSSPMFRKQQAVGSNPTAGSHKNLEFKRPERIMVRAALSCLEQVDPTVDPNASSHTLGHPI